MPSRAERLASLQVPLEHAARVLASGVLVWLLVRSLGSPAAAPGSADARSLPAALRRWSTASAPERVHARVDGLLSPTVRDWLAALPGAGTRVSWESRGALPLAAVLEPVADPAGASRVLVAAPAGALVALADQYGPLDSVRAGPAGARFLARSAPARVGVRAGALIARAAITDSLVFGRLLLLGRAGWESKFVAAALEERGWRVDVKLSLSPRGDVVQGTVAPLESPRYSAVILLDTSALAMAPRLVSYVRSGGGLIVAAPASEAPGLAALGAGRLQPADSAVQPFDSAASEPRRDLALTPIALRTDAVALERRGARVAIAARRVERGRVIVVGYDDTWRWRMGGGHDALEQHRAWWAELVAGVARVRRLPRALDAAVDEAPLVHLLERLGPETTSAAGAPAAGIGSAWLFAALASLLLLEWASRRLRGAR